MQTKKIAKYRAVGEIFSTVREEKILPLGLNNLFKLGGVQIMGVQIRRGQGQLYMKKGPTLKMSVYFIRHGRIHCYV